MVLRAPTSTRVQPTARRWPSGKRSASRSPRPAPRAARVPAIRASSGKVIRVSLMTVPPKKSLCSSVPPPVRPSALVGQDPAPEALRAPDPRAEAFELDDLAVVDEEVDLGPIVLDVPREDFG